MDIIEILGYVAAVGTTSSFIPQAYKVFKTKRTEDLSLGMFLFFSLGTLLWIIYGFRVNSLQVILANIIVILLASYILGMKIKHVSTRKKNNKYYL